MTELYQVGAITQTHGIRGEVKVFPMTDDVSRFKNMKELILDTGKEQIVLEVTSARPQKNLVILKFKGIDNINDVEKYKGCGLFVTKENCVKCKKDEYFIALSFCRSTGRWPAPSPPGGGAWSGGRSSRRQSTFPRSL